MSWPDLECSYMDQGRNLNFVVTLNKAEASVNVHKYHNLRTPFTILQRAFFSLIHLRSEVQLALYQYPEINFYFLFCYGKFYP
jgi:hypothetical protein